MLTIILLYLFSVIFLIFGITLLVFSIGYSRWYKKTWHDKINMNVPKDLIHTTNIIGAISLSLGCILVILGLKQQKFLF
jgi:hypothetical protein